MPFTRSAASLALSLVLCLGAARASADVVAVVSARSPVTSLSNDQMVDIFLGRSSHFPDGSKAVPIDQVEGSGEREDFYLRFAGKSPAQLKAHWAKVIFTGRGHPPVEVLGPSEVRKLLQANPNAIAYIDQSLVDSSLRVLSTP